MSPRSPPCATPSTMAIGAFGGIDILVSNAGIASSAPIDETSLSEWNRNQSILVTGYFLVSRSAFGLFASRPPAGRSCSSPPRTPWWRARTPPPTRRPRRPSSTWPDAWPRRAAATESVSTVSIRMPSCRARGSGGRHGARSAPRPTASIPMSSRSTTGTNRSRGQRVSRGHRSRRPALRIRRALGQEHGQHSQRRWRRRGGVHALGDDQALGYSSTTARASTGALTGRRQPE